MTRFAIIATDSGLVQWIGDGATARDVLIAFDNAVGINPHGLPLDDVAQNFRALELTTPKIEAALIDWTDNGSPAAECPIDERRLIAA